MSITAQGIEHLFSMAGASEFLQLPPTDVDRALKAVGANPVLGIDRDIFFDARDVMRARDRLTRQRRTTKGRK